MAYVEVEVDLTDFDDQDLIDELEERGWFVGPDKDYEPLAELDDEERYLVAATFQNSLPGTIGHSIYEKLRKR